MDKYKEYLDPDNGYALIKQVGSLPVADHWIEVPKGAEKYLSGAAFIVSGPATPFFYKKENGHDCEFYENDWHIHPRSLNEKYFNDALWSRESIQEQGLISGADALRALADGNDVLYQGSKNWRDAKSITLNVNDFLDVSRGYKFKIKPRTIKLELEIPVPLSDAEQMKGQVYYLNDGFPDGYGLMELDPNDTPFTMGAWRTEEEIKQVVAALRGIKG